MIALRRTPSGPARRKIILRDCVSTRRASKIDLFICHVLHVHPSWCSGNTPDCPSGTLSSILSDGVALWVARVVEGGWIMTACALSSCLAPRWFKSSTHHFYLLSWPGEHVNHRTQILCTLYRRCQLHLPRRSPTLAMVTRAAWSHWA